MVGAGIPEASGGGGGGGEVRGGRLGQGEEEATIAGGGAASARKVDGEASSPALPPPPPRPSPPSSIRSGGDEDEPIAPGNSVPLSYQAASPSTYKRDRQANVEGREEEEESKVVAAVVELPYDGHVDLTRALQEATKRGDCRALKKLFEEQKRQLHSPRVNVAPSSAASREVRMKLAEAWEDLGGGLVDGGGGDDAAGIEEELGLVGSIKHILREQDLASIDSADWVTHKEDPRRALRLRSLSLDSLWTLMEAPLRNPELNHLPVLSTLSRIAVASRRGMISNAGKHFLKRGVLGGRVEQVEVVLSGVGAPGPAELDDAASDAAMCPDPLIADFRCPITHEIMLDPVTISCGHTFGQAALVQFLQRARVDNTCCPQCRTPIREQASHLNVNKLLQRTITRLCGERLEALALEEVMKMKEEDGAGPEATPRLNELLDRYPDNPRIARAALELLSSWVLNSTANSSSSSSFTELLHSKTLQYLIRRLATVNRLVNASERLWVVETVFRVLRSLSSMAPGAVRQLATNGVPSVCFTHLRGFQQLVRPANQVAEERQLGTLADILHIILAFLDSPINSHDIWFPVDAQQPRTLKGNSPTAQQVDGDEDVYAQPEWSSHVTDIAYLWTKMLQSRQQHLLLIASRQEQDKEADAGGSRRCTIRYEHEALCKSALRAWQGHQDHDGLTRATLTIATAYYSSSRSASPSASPLQDWQQFLQDHCLTMLSTSASRPVETQVLAARLLLIAAMDDKDGSLVAPIVTPWLPRIRATLEAFDGRTCELESLLSSHDTQALAGHHHQWEATFEETSRATDVVLDGSRSPRVSFNARGWALGPPMPPSCQVTIRFKLERDKHGDQASCIGLCLSESSFLPSSEASYHDQSSPFILLRSFSGELFYRGRAIAKWPDQRVEPGQELVMTVDTRRGKVSFSNPAGKRASKIFRTRGGKGQQQGLTYRPLVMSYGRGPPNVQPIITIVSTEVSPAPEKQALDLQRLCFAQGSEEAVSITVPASEGFSASSPQASAEGADGDEDKEERVPLLDAVDGRGSSPTVPSSVTEAPLTAAIACTPCQDAETSTPTFSFKLKRDPTTTTTAMPTGQGRGTSKGGAECFVGLLGYQTITTTPQDTGGAVGGAPSARLIFLLVLSSAGDVLLDSPGHGTSTRCKIKCFGRHHLVRRQIQANVTSGSAAGCMDVRLEVRSGSSTLWWSGEDERAVTVDPQGGPLSIKPFVAFAGHEHSRRKTTVFVSVSRAATTDANVRDLRGRLNALTTAAAMASKAEKAGAFDNVKIRISSSSDELGGQREEDGDGDWVAPILRAALESLRGGGEDDGDDDQVDHGTMAVAARDTAIVRRFGFDLHTIRSLVDSSRRRHIWHLSCLVLPDAVQETVEVSRVFYAGDARQLMVFSATRGGRDPRALRDGSLWQVLETRDVDMAPLPPAAEAMSLSRPSQHRPPHFHVQTQELSPPLRVQIGAHLGIAARERGDLSVPGYRDPRFLRVPYYWQSGGQTFVTPLPSSEEERPGLRLEFDGEGDASQIAFGFDTASGLPAATHSPQDAGPIKHDEVTDDDEGGSDHDTIHHGGGVDEAAVGDGGGGGGSLDPTLRRLRELDRVLAEVLHHAAMRAVEEAQMRVAAGRDYSNNHTPRLRYGGGDDEEEEEEVRQAVGDRRGEAGQTDGGGFQHESAGHRDVFSPPPPVS